MMDKINPLDYYVVLAIPAPVKRFMECDDNQRAGARVNAREENINGLSPVLIDDWQQKTLLFLNGVLQPPFNDIEISMDANNQYQVKLKINCKEPPNRSEWQQ